MILKFPCENHTISLSFGYDASKDSDYSGFYELFDNKHPGVDFEIPVGTEVFSSFSGIVVRSDFHKGMGNTVGIRNGNILALYAHLSEIRVKLGDIVDFGDLVGKSGNTGSATTGPHLHFELRDLRFKTLKEMVFKPEFETNIANFYPEFIYKVNNTNTSKTLDYLSRMYFGSSRYISKIRELNSLNLDDFDTLPQNLEVKIPNF